MRDPGRLAAHADAEAEALAARVRGFAELRGDERALDAGTGVGALALALAPLVREVVAVDVEPASLERARARAAAAGVANVEWLQADATRLPFDDDTFDLAACLRVLHHVRRPELVVAELARVTHPGGRLLVVDQIAPADPLVAFELDRFERARDPGHGRLLPDGDVRALLEMNGLVVRRDRIERESRPLGPYLDLAGCEGEARERAAALAPGDPYHVELGWYLAERRGARSYVA
jgi:SAM-dependent methyltransferase